jgi:hypothetical protein
MSLVSRKTTPSRRCYDRRGLPGCYTTGWQDNVELEPRVERMLQRSQVFAKRVQRLFKRHARNLPRFLHQGYEQETFEMTGPARMLPGTGALYMATECSSGTPTWDLNRAGDYRHEQCNLWTRIAFT